MSPTRGVPETAQRVADRLKAKPPWEVYAEHSRRFEVHVNGKTVELTRGPIALEGYGLRVLRFREGKTAVGFQASTDLSEKGVHAALADAERITRYSEFPAARVELPSSSAPPAAAPAVVDKELWEHPVEAVDHYVSTLLSCFEGRRQVTPSFGSVRATLTETSIVNSNGLRVAYPQTTVEFEVAVKAFGGPEGPPPGEYWVNDSGRRLDPASLPAAVDRWCQYAEDVRRAVPPPTGELAVVLPTEVLSGILPTSLGFKVSGSARLRKIAVSPGQRVAAEQVTVVDDGCYDWSLPSSPYDDEGSPQRSRTLVSAGVVQDLVYDSMYGAAFGVPTTSSAVRSAFGGTLAWRRFSRAPTPGATTLAVSPGDGGTDRELIEAAGDGVWVQQLGWAVPDPISSSFGGEIRIGYRIRNGKLAEPVRGGTIGGVVVGAPDAPSMLRGIQALGSTSQLADGFASPTMLVRPLSVAGSSA